MIPNLLLVLFTTFSAESFSKINERIEFIDENYYHQAFDVSLTHESYDKNELDMERVERILGDMTQALGREMEPDELERQRQIIIQEMGHTHERYRYILSKDYVITYRGYNVDGITYDEVIASDFVENKKYVIDFWNDTITISDTPMGIDSTLFDAIYPEGTLGRLKVRSEVNNSGDWIRISEINPLGYEAEAIEGSTLRRFDISYDPESADFFLYLDEKDNVIERVFLHDNGRVGSRKRWEEYSPVEGFERELPKRYVSEFINSEGVMVMLTRMEIQSIRGFSEDDKEDLLVLLADIAVEGMETFILEGGVKTPHPFPF